VRRERSHFESTGVIANLIFVATTGKLLNKVQNQSGSCEREHLTRNRRKQFDMAGLSRLQLYGNSLRQCMCRVSRLVGCYPVTTYLGPNNCAITGRTLSMSSVVIGRLISLLRFHGRIPDALVR